MLGLLSSRRRGALALVAAALVITAATGCDAGVPAAAKVNGASIGRAEVMKDLEAEEAAAKKAGASSAAGGNPLSSPTGEAPGTFTTTAAAAALTHRIEHRLYQLGLDSLGATVSAADTEQAKATICVDQSGQAPTDGSCPPLADYTAAYRDFQIELAARQVAFSNAVAREAYPTIKAKAPASLKQVCVDLVQVLTEDLARQVQLEVAGGSTLAEAAAKIEPDASGNPQAGQVQSGCLFVSTAPEALAPAKVGEAVPISQGGAFYVADVLRFTTATLDEFVASPPSQDAAVAKVIAPIAQKILDAAHISVDPRFGRWDADNLAVVPAEGPAAAGPSTTVPAAGLIPANP